MVYDLMKEVTALATASGITTLITKEDAVFVITLLITFLNFMLEYLKNRKEKKKEETKKEADKP